MSFAKRRALAPLDAKRVSNAASSAASLSPRVGSRAAAPGHGRAPPPPAWFGSLGCGASAAATGAAAAVEHNLAALW